MANSPASRAAWANRYRFSSAVMLVTALAVILARSPLPTLCFAISANAAVDCPNATRARISAWAWYSLAGLGINSITRRWIFASALARPAMRPSAWAFSDFSPTVSRLSRNGRALPLSRSVIRSITARRWAAGAHSFRRTRAIRSFGQPGSTPARMSLRILRARALTSRSFEPVASISAGSAAEPHCHNFLLASSRTA